MKVLTIEHNLHSSFLPQHVKFHTKIIYHSLLCRLRKKIRFGMPGTPLSALQNDRETVEDEDVGQGHEDDRPLLPEV